MLLQMTCFNSFKDGLYSVGWLLYNVYLLYPFIHWWKNTLVPYYENAAENSWCLHHPDSFPLNIYSEVEMLGKFHTVYHSEELI